jgi:hypothetical protein
MTQAGKAGNFDPKKGGKFEPSHKATPTPSAPARAQAQVATARN